MMMDDENEDEDVTTMRVDETRDMIRPREGYQTQRKSAAPAATTAVRTGTAAYTRSAPFLLVAPV